MTRSVKHNKQTILLTPCRPELNNNFDGHLESYPVLKIAAHGAHVRGTKASLGGPKSWWTRKLMSFESGGNQSVEMTKQYRGQNNSIVSTFFRTTILNLYWKFDCQINTVAKYPYLSFVEYVKIYALFEGTKPTQNLCPKDQIQF